MIRLIALLVLVCDARWQPSSCSDRDWHDGKACCCYDSHLRRLGLECDLAPSIPQYVCLPEDKLCVCHLP